MAFGSKTISLRISLDEYYRILSECESKSISITEWLERQIALANKFKISKSLLLDYILEEELKGRIDVELKLKLVSIKRGIREF